MSILLSQAPELQAMPKASPLSSEVHNIVHIMTLIRNPRSGEELLLLFRRKPDDTFGGRLNCPSGHIDGSETNNKPGALYNAIGCFVKKGINMTYLQSRPIIGKPWNYIFYAECEGSMESRPMSGACRELARNAKSFRFLGSYAKAKVLG